ncbi:RHS repeat-associated core domain-containing protein, partial [Pseudomonas poae]|uniref:RHS repeat-associated core domain-containing protein n=1 Tax=Pseudomonas poae TaxID=200451 RepID=UPI00164616BB
QGDKLIAEHHADRHRSYLYEPDSFRPLALLEGFGPNATNPYHYQLDHLGTPQELTAADGEIVWSAHYRAYGQISHLDVDKIDNPLRFQGQYFDQESGLHYNRHRYYNPDVGRYLTPDPVKLAGGINAYQYVPNPTGWVDPLGLSVCPGGDGCKPSHNAESPTKHTKADNGEPTLPAHASKQETIVRVRHYTSRAGSKGIEKTGVILAQDNNRVYLEPAKSKVLSPRDAQEKYQIDKSKGRDYIETDVHKSQLELVKNPRYSTMELTIKGNLTLNNPTFTRRK